VLTATASDFGTPPANTETRLATDASTRNVIWGADVVPTPLMADNTVEDAATIPPRPADYYYDISRSPDSEWEHEGGYAKALLQAGGGRPDGCGGRGRR
jgi:hypothetical protein